MENKAIIRSLIIKKPHLLKGQQDSNSSSTFKKMSATGTAKQNSPAKCLSISKESIQQSLQQQYNRHPTAIQSGQNNPIITPKLLNLSGLTSEANFHLNSILDRNKYQDRIERSQCSSPQSQLRPVLTNHTLRHKSTKSLLFLKQKAAFWKKENNCVYSNSSKYQKSQSSSLNETHYKAVRPMAERGLNSSKNAHKPTSLKPKFKVLVPFEVPQRITREQTYQRRLENIPRPQLRLLAPSIPFLPRRPTLIALSNNPWENMTQEDIIDLLRRLEESPKDVEEAIRARKRLLLKVSPINQSKMEYLATAESPRTKNMLEKYKKLGVNIKPITQKMIDENNHFLATKQAYSLTPESDNSNSQPSRILKDASKKFIKMSACKSNPTEIDINQQIRQLFKCSRASANKLASDVALMPHVNHVIQESELRAFRKGHKTAKVL